MRMTTRIQKIYKKIMGDLFVPPILLHTKDKKVLHLSDTPSSLYPAIRDLICTINPQVIIHTGDLADDIKLEYNPNCIDQYTRSVAPFVKMLEESQAQQIYIIPGNHDNVEILSRHCQRIQFLNEGSEIKIDSSTFGVAHKLKRLPECSQFRLYGHNFKAPASGLDETVYLNGIRHINVILLPSKQVVKILYPWSTNRDRKMNDSLLPKTI